VWRAGNHRDPVGHERACHRDSDAKIGCAIINARQNVAMQVDHTKARTRFCAEAIAR
jgi:hypothetical protein